MNPQDWLTLLDTLDVPTVFVTMLWLAYRHDKKLEASLAKQQEAFVAAMHNITLRISSVELKADIAARDLAEHADRDQKSFDKIFDKLDKLTGAL